MPRGKVGSKNQKTAVKKAARKVLGAAQRGVKTAVKSAGKVATLSGRKLIKSASKLRKKK